MLKSVREWVGATKARRWTAGALGAAMLVAGLGFIAAAVTGPMAPDPKTASDDALIAFLAKDGPDRLGARERDAFLRATADRMMAMGRDDRRAFNERWKDADPDDEARRKVRAQIDMSMARQLADSYERTPPAERAAFLDRVLFMVSMAGPGGEKFMQWLDSNPMDQAIREPEAFQKDLTPLQRQLVSGTSAKERANLVRLGGDLLKRAKERGR